LLNRASVAGDIGWSASHKAGGIMPHVEWVDKHEVARRLLHSDHELPDDLVPLADELIE
jgi:hypothetical protein